MAINISNTSLDSFGTFDASATVTHVRVKNGAQILVTIQLAHLALDWGERRSADRRRRPWTSSLIRGRMWTLASNRSSLPKLIRGWLLRC